MSHLLDIPIRKPNRLSKLHIVSAITRVLLRILVFIVIALAMIPVALLPISTTVPPSIQILFAMAEVALLIAVFRLGFTARVVLAELAGFAAIALLAIFASQLFASTPPILGSNSQPIPNSIAVLEKVNLGGSHQWITIRGKDSRNPVLLYITDAHELILSLQQRFDKEKVYVLGESWGSALGIMMVQRYPELFHAFIGTGQMVAFLENDQICYDLALRLAQERGDTQQVEKLRRQEPPPYYGRDVTLKFATYITDLNNYMNKNPVIANGGFSTLQDLAGSEYGLYDKVNFVRGLLDTFPVVYPQLWDVDFRLLATHFEAPVYFLIGRHDVSAPPKLAEEYFNILTAPRKELIWFERSGHSPWINESAKFVEMMVSKVLKNTGGSDDQTNIS